MTKRLVALIVAVVVATLVVVGAVTFLLARRAASRTTEQNLRENVQALAEGLDGLDVIQRPAQQRVILRSLRRALRVDDIELVTLTPDGDVAGRLPAGVELDSGEVASLAAGDPVSGTSGDVAYAAAPSPFRRGNLIVVASQPVTSGLDQAWRWFVIAGAVTAGLGLLGAVLVGRRLARPIQEAEAVAQRIAAGDLDARLPQPRASDRDEMAELTRSINAMAEHLARSRELEQQFLLSISHDLRTPLTSIRGYAEAIADGETADPAAAARVVLAESRRLERLVGDLLDLARLDARTFSLHVAPTDLRPLLTEAVSAGRVDGARVEAEVPDEPVVAEVDADRMRQVLGNLLDNAARYARSRVRASLDVVAGEAEVLVDDDGPGIAPEDLPHVFERLYVATRSPTRAESRSGLGLAIVRQLTEAMGGTVHAETSPLGGTRMVVRLPLATSLARASVVPAASPADLPASQPGTSARAEPPPPSV